jgi:hypothetical protein
MVYLYVCTYLDKIIYITLKRLPRMENWIMDYYKSAQNFG